MKNKATTWWALYHYFPALENKIGAETINQPSNVITLDPALHAEFGVDDAQMVGNSPWAELHALSGPGTVTLEGQVRYLFKLKC